MPPLVAIACIGMVIYATRLGGFVAARWVPHDSLAARLLRLAPGNLFVAFGIAETLQGGWSYGLGSLAAMAAMVVTSREWAALAAGAATVALMAWGR
ncbi:MAG: AzlD domain-containing protein [Alphaproteobacteria bacterium]